MNIEQASQIRNKFANDLKGFSNHTDRLEWRRLLRAEPDYQVAWDETKNHRHMLFLFRDDAFFHQGVLQEAESALGEITGASLRLGAYSSSLPDAKRKQWGHALKLYNGSQEFIGEIDKIRKDPNVIPESPEKRALTEGMVLGGRLLVFDVLQNMKAILRTNEDKTVERVITLGEIINCAPLEIGDGNKKLIDLYKDDFLKKHIPGEVFDYFSLIMQLSRASGSKAEGDRLWAINNDRFDNQYPFYLKNAQREAQDIVVSLYSLRPGFFGSPGNNLILGGSYKRANEFLTNYSHLKKEINKLLFSPDNPEFEQLKASFTSYLNFNDRYLSTFLFSTVNGLYIDDARIFLRKAKQLSNHPQHGEFYMKLSESLEELIENNKENVLPSIDDLDQVIEDQKNSTERATTAEDVRKAVDAVTQVSGWKNVELVSFDISWNGVGMMRPTTLSFQFSKDNPYMIKIILTYKQDIDEPFNVSIDINAAKNTFDWSIREDPTFYPTHQAKLLLVAKHLLEEIQEKAQGELDKKQQKTLTVSISSPREKRVKREDAEKSVRVVQTKEVITPIKLALAEDIKELQKPVQRYRFEFPNNVQYVALMNGIPADDQALINTKLKDFVRVGKGKFKQLESPGPNGEKQFRLRAGHYRVVFIEEQSPKGNVLHIDAIKHRDRVYRAVDRR